MNSFALLEAGDENGDDIDQLVKAAKVQAAKENEAAAAAAAVVVRPDTKPAAKEVASTRPESGRGAGRGGRGEGRVGEGRGGRGEGRVGEGRGGRGEGRGRGPRPDGASAPEGENGEVTKTDGERRHRERDGERRPRAEGRGEGRGGEGGRGRREYERHDGTGRGHEMAKKGGQGKANWGAPGDEGEPKPEDAPKVEGEVEEVAAEVAVPEPVAEEKQMSLDEYEAVLAEKKAALNKKAAEKKVNMDEFKGLKTYVRVETSDEITGVELSKHKEAAEKVAEEVAEVAEKVSKKKTTLETSFKYDAPEPTREGGRGGRGEGRGGRGGERRDRGGRGEGGRGGRGGGGGRGGDRPAPSSAPRAAGAGRAPAMGSLAIDDASAFPSLA